MKKDSHNSLNERKLRSQQSFTTTINEYYKVIPPKNIILNESNFSIVKQISQSNQNIRFSHNENYNKFNSPNQILSQKG